MDKRLVLTTVFFTLYFATFGQFKQNSIGVCYLQKDTTTDYYSLTITLPIQTLEKTNFKYLADSIHNVIDTLTYSGQIILFDSYGEVCRIDNRVRFLIEFWCDNDGGTQFRPTLRTTIKKSYCKRQLNEIKEIQNICCFALLNKNESELTEPDYKISSDIRLKGDYNQDGKTDCFIWTYNDDAQNCYGEPKNNLGIMLQIGETNYRLRCCGP